MNEVLASEAEVKASRSGKAGDLLKDAYETGLQWGRVRRMTHPKMQPYILASKGEVQIIDLVKTMEALERVSEFLKKSTTQDRASVLFVGTQPAARPLVETYAKKLGFPYVNERWLGGTLTNFKTLAGRIQYLKDLEQKIKSEEFASYTKKERLKMQKEAEELRKKFEGLRNMAKLPDAVLLIGVKRHLTALREARRMNVPVIAIVNTNDDPSEIQYLIPGNDNSARAIDFVLAEIERAWTSNQKLENEVKD
jgi:small subunit ribosomal protein S2